VGSTETLPLMNTDRKEANGNWQLAKNKGLPLINADDRGLSV
jgi:hypothetical protein